MDLARLWPEGETGEARLGLAVSGGPDSLALLLLGAALLPGRIAAATVDHGLRPESAAEAAMVARVCAELGIAHRVLAVRVEPGNLQSRARAARYAALGAWLESEGLAALATAHQLDDQAETLVMRLNRGSGLSGLAGVRGRGLVPGTGWPLLRPLLGWRRAELAEIVAAAGLDPARDPSNEDEAFDRVRVRKALDEADWIDAEGFARSAALAAGAESYLAEQIAAAWAARVARTEEGFVCRAAGHDFESVELVLRILAAMGGQAGRTEAAQMVERLRAGDNASLAGVLARPRRDGTWHFAPEPPRANP